MVDLVERLAVLMKQEVDIYSGQDFLAPSFQHKLAKEGSSASLAASFGIQQSPSNPPSSQSSSSTSINEIWREKICEWSYQVVDHFDFSREVVAIAIKLLDMYLSKRAVDKQIFQLAAMTTLYLAIKLNERGTLSMKSMIELSRGYFMPDQMRLMEMSILQDLSWYVHPPTPFCFARHYAHLFPPSSCGPAQRHDIMELTRFLTELSVIDYYFVTRKSSNIALGALLNAIDMSGHLNYHARCEFLSNLKHLPGVDPSSSDVKECRARLKELYQQGGYVHTPPSDERQSALNEGRTETISPVSVANAFHEAPPASDACSDPVNPEYCL